MRDLRSFLAEHADALWELPEAVSLRHELTALQHALDDRGEFPILMARNVQSLDGLPSRLGQAVRDGLATTLRRPADPPA